LPQRSSEPRSFAALHPASAADEDASTPEAADDAPVTPAPEAPTLPFIFMIG
jgi:hypothetical protein